LIAWYPMDFRVPATCRLRGRFAEAPFWAWPPASDIFSACPDVYAAAQQVE
jgi:hypothetical protein